MIQDAAQRAASAAKTVAHGRIPVSDSEPSSQLRGGRWPRAWRLLFILGCSIALWGIIVVVARWI
jgi:hypothetical protein